MVEDVDKVTSFKVNPNGQVYFGGQGWNWDNGAKPKIARCKRICQNEHLGQRQHRVDESNIKQELQVTDTTSVTTFTGSHAEGLYIRGSDSTDNYA